MRERWIGELFLQNYEPDVLGAIIMIENEKERSHSPGNSVPFMLSYLIDGNQLAFQFSAPCSKKK